MNKPIRFDRIHGICDSLRGIENPPRDCEGCPAYVRLGPYRVKSSCRMIAEEVSRIAVYGNPWGVGVNTKLVRSWRKEIAKRHLKHEKPRA
jgi:hypothetical protein